MENIQKFVVADKELSSFVEWLKEARKSVVLMNVIDRNSIRIHGDKLNPLPSCMEKIVTDEILKILPLALENTLARKKKQVEKLAEAAEEECKEVLVNAAVRRELAKREQ
jgi:hypothetical protein